MSAWSRSRRAGQKRKARGGGLLFHFLRLPAALLFYSAALHFHLHPQAVAVDRIVSAVSYSSEGDRSTGAVRSRKGNKNELEDAGGRGVVAAGGRGVAGAPLRPPAATTAPDETSFVTAGLLNVNVKRKEHNPRNRRQRRISLLEVVNGGAPRERDRRSPSTPVEDEEHQDVDLLKAKAEDYTPRRTTSRTFLARRAGRGEPWHTVPAVEETADDLNQGHLIGGKEDLGKAKDRAIGRRALISSPRRDVEGAKSERESDEATSGTDGRASAQGVFLSDVAQSVKLKLKSESRGRRRSTTSFIATKESQGTRESAGSSPLAKLRPNTNGNGMSTPLSSPPSGASREDGDPRTPGGARDHDAGSRRRSSLLQHVHHQHVVQAASNLGCILGIVAAALLLVAVPLVIYFCLCKGTSDGKETRKDSTSTQQTTLREETLRQATGNVDLPASTAGDSSSSASDTNSSDGSASDRDEPRSALASGGVFRESDLFLKSSASTGAPGRPTGGAAPGDHDYTNRGARGREDQSSRGRGGSTKRKSSKRKKAKVKKSKTHEKVAQQRQEGSAQTDDEEETPFGADFFHDLAADDEAYDQAPAAGAASSAKNPSRGHGHVVASASSPSTLARVAPASTLSRVASSTLNADEDARKKAGRAKAPPGYSGGTAAGTGTGRSKDSFATLDTAARKPAFGAGRRYESRKFHAESFAGPSSSMISSSYVGVGPRDSSFVPSLQNEPRMPSKDPMTSFSGKK